jgi:dCMP deaminase
MGAVLEDRPELGLWGLQIAEVVSTRATCARRAVGCVLLDAKGKILATGYNGRASGLTHCAGRQGLRCEGASAPSGTQLSACEAIHAEQNALLACSDVSKIHTAAVTTSPCVTCVKLLMNTGAQSIVFRDLYPDHTESQRLWESAGRKWIHLKPAPAGVDPAVWESINRPRMAEELWVEDWSTKNG